MNLAPSRGGLAGSLDAVIPLHAFSSANNVETRAFFLQNGLTRWTDSHGLDRTDIRYGLVNRYAVPGWLGSGVLGASVFFQENLERGHQRVVTGFDYASRLGSSSLTYFMPTTGWRPGRPGYDEHALEGVEYAFRRDATSTISMNAAAGRWRTEAGLEEWDTRGRVGVDWKPHPWFAIGGSWDDIGAVDDFLQLRATVGIAFGGGHEARARWEGLGRTGADPDDEDSSLAGDVWRSVADIGQINFAEQQTPPPEGSTPDPDAETTASSGTEHRDAGCKEIQRGCSVVNSRRTVTNWMLALPILGVMLGGLSGCGGGEDGGLFPSIPSGTTTTYGAGASGIRSGCTGFSAGLAVGHSSRQSAINAALNQCNSSDYSCTADAFTQRCGAIGAGEDADECTTSIGSGNSSVRAESNALLACRNSLTSPNDCRILLSLCS